MFCLFGELGIGNGKEELFAKIRCSQNLEAVILSSPVLQLLNVDGILGQNFLNNYQQTWQFSQSQDNEFPAEGSLLLIPLEKK